MGPLDQVAQYCIQVIKKVQSEQIKSLTPKQSVTDAFNAHCQEWVTHTVWVDGCRSWYKNNDTGRVNAVWPGSSLHYIQVIKEPRYEDYDIDYMNGKNMWSYLGMGTTKELTTPGSDVSPYLNVGNLDPEWLKAVGIEEDPNTEQTEKALEALKSEDAPKS